MYHPKLCIKYIIMLITILNKTTCTHDVYNIFITYETISLSLFLSLSQERRSIRQNEVYAYGCAVPCRRVPCNLVFCPAKEEKIYHRDFYIIIIIIAYKYIYKRRSRSCVCVCAVQSSRPVHTVLSAATDYPYLPYYIAERKRRWTC